MTKHTAGPWTISPNHNGFIRAANGDTVARVAEYGIESETPQTAIANARLIVAAPDLLASLRETVALASKVYHRGDRPEIIRARALIAQIESAS